jgi:hypothetical protein
MLNKKRSKTCILGIYLGYFRALFDGIYCGQA